MKAFLLFRDRDFDPDHSLPANEATLAQDLELTTLFNAMAAGDKFLFDICRKVVLLSQHDPAEIRYRQDILKDCLKNPDAVRRIYALTVEAIDKERRRYLGLFSGSPSSVVYRSIEILGLFADAMTELRQIADEHAAQFASDGFVTLLTMLQRELADDYIAEVRAHLRQLHFRGGVLISAELGAGGKGANYVLRRQNDADQGWLGRFFSRQRGYTFRLHPRDENGFRALGELRDRGLNLVADALGRSTDHVLSFFHMLRTELAFYVGCLNLGDELKSRGEPICFPNPHSLGDRTFSCRGLYDVCLSLTLPHHVVGNTVMTKDKDLTIVTGANQGGKSTFLRSVGLAQLMMQSGLFVAAEEFGADVCSGIFTHYKREEDAAMKSGKLDEELARMSEIVDQLSPNALVLFNESFAATNEREGSEIARQIVRALLDRHIKLFFVTHFYNFANGFWAAGMPNALFLRAERRADGERTFKIVAGEPLSTSYGRDLYDKIFREQSPPPQPHKLSTAV